MGSATRRKQALLKANPYCIFCGGRTPATSVEHCPPRALFQFREWPEGFEFPACDACNGGTSDDDLLLSMLGRMNPFDDSSDRDGRTKGTVMSVLRQFPGIGERMQLSAGEARRQNRLLGLKPGPGQLHQETGVANIPPEMHKAVGIVGGKLSKAVYFRHTGRAFPAMGCIVSHWFPNVHLITSGDYPVLKAIEHFHGVAPTLVRGGKFLNDQFSYKVTIDTTYELMVLQAVFGKAFGFLAVANCEPGPLEAFHQELVAKNPGKPGTFAVLQSSLIPLTWPAGVQAGQIDGDAGHGDG